jgi:thymidine phosphorylase
MAVLPQETIQRKRNGETLTGDEIARFVEGFTAGTISEGQVAAFAMAVWFNGMSRDETVALTLAMRDSGDVLDWSDLARPIADKHSTGGVGDNVSLMLAPIVASLGVAVPMISGRGLGHTGGTLDKLQSIAGYDIMPDEAHFRKTVAEVGCAIIGQTGDLAPADKRLYAIRDVTATVDSVPLITASILSKKLAAGLQTLTLDVKVGSGAFMTDIEEARVLARSLVEVANGAGVRTSALITDMNEPLADCAGNALEVIHALDFLKGLKSGSRSEEVTLALAAAMLVSAGVAASASEGRDKAREALASGRALETFARMIAALGGPGDFVERPWDHMAKAPVERVIEAQSDGVLAACNARAVGLSVIGLGGGRTIPSERIDHAVGFSGLLPLGTYVHRGDPIAWVHARDDATAERARAEILSHFTIGEGHEAPSAAIIEAISS